MQFRDNLNFWQPFFRNTWNIWQYVPWVKQQHSWVNHSKRLDTIQTAKLQYTPIAKNAAAKLEEELTSLIKNSFLDWRINAPQFNLYVGSRLQKVLREFEIAKQKNEQIEEERHATLLSDVLKSYMLIGFPLNFTFTDIKSVLDEVKNTLIYEIEDKDSAFAVGVYVHPYVNNVFSVWVYLTALISR